MRKKDKEIQDTGLEFINSHFNTTYEHKKIIIEDYNWVDFYNTIEKTIGIKVDKLLAGKILVFRLNKDTHYPPTMLYLGGSRVVEEEIKINGKGKIISIVHKKDDITETMVKSFSYTKNGTIDTYVEHDNYGFNEFIFTTDYSGNIVTVEYDIDLVTFHELDEIELNHNTTKIEKEMILGNLDSHFSQLNF